MHSKIAENLVRYRYWIISLTSLAVYAQTIGFDLTYCDDHDIILTYFDRISNFSNFISEFFTGYIGTGYYRPIINISFLLDAQIAGQELWIYHLSNIVYHTLFAVFLYKLLEKLEINKSISLIAVLIFIVHPLNVNAVAWIVGRNDSIMALFSVLSFIFLLNYSKSGKILHLALFGLFILLSVLTKESGFFFIPVIFYYLTRERNVQYKSKIFLYSMITVGLALILCFFFRLNASLGQTINNMGFDVLLFNLRVIPEYIGKFFVPVNTSVLATYSTFNTTLGLVVMLIIGSLVIYVSRRQELNYKRLIFGALWFLFPILPTLFISIINVNDWNEYVECRAYLPVIGLMLIIIELLPPNFNIFSRVNGLVLLLIFVVFTSGTVIESRNYKDSITFYNSAIKDDSEKPLFHFVLSRRYREAQMYDLEEKSIRNAMDLRPGYFKYPYNFGLFFYARKQYDSAVKYLNIAMKIDPKYRDVYKSLSSIYFMTGNFKSAYNILALATQYTDNTDEFEMNMAAALFMIGDYSKLDSLISQFLIQNKFQNDLYSFFLSTGESALQAKEYNRAIKAFEYCILINPKYLDPYLRLLIYYIEVDKNKEKATYYFEIFKQFGEKIPENLISEFEKL
jgi:tetratricopeptide (TPR) repeat protein